MPPRFSAWVSVAWLLLAGLSAARADDGAPVQFWPEGQAHIALDPHTKIILLANLTRDRETSRNLEGQLGVNIDYRLTDIFSVRAGYRFAGSLVEDDPYTEHRILLEQTFQFRLPYKFQLALRTREDLRLVN